MVESGINEAMIRQKATPKSFGRGEQLVQNDAVESLTRRGDSWQAQVAGSEGLSYRVSVWRRGDGEMEALCSCPYEYGGWCKHIVAVTLAAVRAPQTVEEKPELGALLEPLERDQLISLLLKLAERDPDLADDIASQVALLASPGASSPGMSTHVAVNPLPYRRQVRALLHSLDDMRDSDAYWHVGGVVKGVDQTLDAARDLLAVGDGRGALAIIEAVTEEYLKGWTLLDDSDGEASSPFHEAGTLLAEAILTADLTPEERGRWADVLGGWRDDVEDYGVEDAFEAAIEAAHQGWDHAPLVRVLEGKSKSSLWKDTPYYARDLTRARLRVLERRERFDEYLRLAAAENETELRVVMLAKQGRAEDAVRETRSLRAAGECLLPAQALYENGAVEEAFQVAEHGLKLSGSDPEVDFLNRAPDKATLAIWLRDAADSRGQNERALMAARVAVVEEPNLHHYERARELAGDWPPVREELLKHLRRLKPSNRGGLVDIFLHESLMDDALAAVKGSWDGDLIGRVVDAAIPTRAKIVLPICHRQAEAIMDGGKSSRYEEAARWLQRARAAYDVAGNKAQWHDYLSGLLERHKKKYRLRPLLEALRD